MVLAYAYAALAHCLRLRQNEYCGYALAMQCKCKCVKFPIFLTCHDFEKGESLKVTCER